MVIGGDDLCEVLDHGTVKRIRSTLMSVLKSDLRPPANTAVANMQFQLGTSATMVHARNSASLHEQPSPECRHRAAPGSTDPNAARE
jgi:hypothetical protein